MPLYSIETVITLHSIVKSDCVCRSVNRQYKLGGLCPLHVKVTRGGLELPEPPPSIHPCMYLLVGCSVYWVVILVSGLRELDTPIQ